MNIFISEADRQSARRIALKNIARFFNIADWESKSNDELFEEISILSDPPAVVIFKLLEVYFKAYDEWFAFYQQRKKIELESEKEYKLSNKDELELGTLINKRQSALNALQEAFDQIQFKKFQLQKFGHEMSGIIYNQ